jgi:pyrimidine 5'-nucleotidase
MKYTTLFFDLDETLYPTENGLWQLISDRISAYMLDIMGLDPEIVPALRKRLYETYGTTFGGLRREFQIDEQGFLGFVHDLPLKDYIKPDPELRRMLLAYPQEKWIFTNADAGHAWRILKALEVADCFKGVIDILDIDPHCKPHPQAYQIALQMAGQQDPVACVFVDDRWPNLESAQKIGFFTVQVGSHPRGPEDHPYIPVITELPKVLPPEDT